MVEDGSTASAEIKATQLRSTVEETARKLFDDPRRTSIDLWKPIIEFQNEFQNLCESYPEIKDKELTDIEVQKDRGRSITLEIQLFFCP